MEDLTTGSITRHLRWIWYLSVASVIAQLLMNLLLLKREFRLRLSFAG